MKKSDALRWISICGTLAVVTVMWLLGYFWDAGPGGSGVLASLRLGDGSQYMVTQKYSWPEGYVVDFYMRSESQPWGRCYIDYEANRWREVTISFDPSLDIVSVTERGNTRAVLNRKRNTFWFDNGSQHRETKAPQKSETPAFAFPTSQEQR